MGIDTVKLRSPTINEGLAQLLEQQCILKSGVDLASGVVLYEITSGELEGSFDSRISFQVKREEWINVGGRLSLEKCQPYILVEASLHKFRYGQNVYGQVVDFQNQCRLFVDFLGDLLGGEEYYGNNQLLPAVANWSVRRVDWAEVYRLTPAAIREFFRGISQCKFPRRSAKTAKYGDNSAYFPGVTTTLKFYHKGPEFKEHDRGRLRRTLLDYYLRQAGKDEDGTRRGNGHVEPQIERKLKALQRLADNRLRVEVEIHADKLQHDFNGSFPLVSQVTDDYLKKVHDAEVFKLLKEGKTEMETVRTYDAVKARLNNVYGMRSANALFAFWMQLSARGEDPIREEYSRTQFYGNRRKLVEAGVSWLSSNVCILPDQETALERGFAPMRGNRRRCEAAMSANSVFNFCPVEWGELKKAA